MSYQQTLENLYEMFPDQSHQIINKVFKECHYSPEVTINHLLKISKQSRSQKSQKSPGSTSPKTSKTASPSQPSQNHIFPDDFLRFPPNVEYVQVDADSGLEGGSPLQGIQDLTFDEASPKMNSLGSMDSLTQTNSSDQAFTGWNNIKNLFLSKKGSGYNQI